MIQETVYHIVCISSSVICILLGYLMLDMKAFLKTLKAKYPMLIPRRYLIARISLGIAYVVLGTLTALQVVLDMPDETETFIPLGGLVIASSQAILFTMAILAFYNSRLANYRMIIINVIPFCCLGLLYVLSGEALEIQKEIRIMWLVLYFIQLIILSLCFLRGRKTYLASLRSHIGKSSICKAYEQQELVPLFAGTLFIGVYALVSFFFTERWMLSVFIGIYTLYYLAVGFYTLRYEKKSPLIFDLSYPDEEFPDMEKDKDADDELDE